MEMSMTVPFSPFFDGSQENQGGLWGGIASMFVPKPNPEEDVAKAKDAGKLAVAAERHQVDISDPDSAQELATQIIVVTQPTAFSFTGGSTVILGGTSGATALVNSSYIDIPSINYWAISVTPVSGTFVDDETITISSGAGYITGTMRVRDFNPFGYSSAQFNESAD